MSAIIDFLSNRKEKWLKNNIKTKMSEKEIADLNKKADEKFAIERWVPDAARRARQLSLASHVCKFSHPDAKASSVISTCSFRKDGYLRSGNVDYGLDAFGNAAAIDVFDFLLTRMDDGMTIIEHLENNSDDIRCELDFTKEYNKLRAEFLEIKKANQEIKSDERVKQVYFPIGDTYHLLSVLTPSGIVTVLRARVNEMIEKAKSSRNKSTEDYGKAYDSIYDLTTIAYGGSNPVNIGALNLRNAGRAYLLSSIPPTIAKREVARPKHDFFSNTLQLKRFSEDFRYLHTLFSCDRNNLHIRNKIKNTFQVIVDKVMISVYQLRETETGWSAADSYSQLPVAQKIWLDDSHAEWREKNGEWLDEVAVSFTRWLIRAYEKVLKDNRVMLGDGEMAFIQSQVETALLEDEGIIR